MIKFFFFLSPKAGLEPELEADLTPASGLLWNAMAFATCTGLEFQALMPSIHSFIHFFIQ